MSEFNFFSQMTYVLHANFSQEQPGPLCNSD